MCCPEGMEGYENPRSDCKRAMGQHGHAIHVDEEIMLVFGGLIKRDRLFTNEQTGE